MRRVPAASAIVTDAAGRILLVRRSSPPEAGRWTLPGGRVEAGERLADAAAREVLEETGLHVRIGAEAGVVERATPDGDVFEIHCFRTEGATEAATEAAADPEPAAGSDAGDARWVTMDELASLDLTRGLRELLRRWGR